MTPMDVVTGPAPQTSTATGQVHDRDVAQRSERQHPMLRAGRFAWAAVGVAGVAALTVWGLAFVSAVMVPLALALFPAAALAPAVGWLKGHRIPPTLAAFVVLLATAVVGAGAGALVVPQVAGQLDVLTSALSAGAQVVERFLAGTPLGSGTSALSGLLANLRSGGDGRLLTGVLGVAHLAVHVLVGAALAVIALFYYLRDGAALFGWLRDRFPARGRPVVQQLGDAVWATIGSYIRGQVIVATSNAVLVALGLLALGVPLVPALAVLVLAGGMFPIVGLLVAGAAAVLVGLAEVGPAVAVATLALILVIHQLEVHIVGPLVQSRALRLHPFAVIVSLATGAAVLGVLGALVAVPVTASIARGVVVLRSVRGLPPA